MGTETMAAFLNLGPTFINENQEDKYKRNLIADILKRDFEVLHKQILLSNVLGDISIYDDPMDELKGVDFAISLGFGKQLDRVDYEVRELLAETCSVGFFDLINFNNTIAEYKFLGLANKLATLIYNTSIRLKGTLFQDTKKVFFEEFLEIFPNLKVEYFESNFQRYLKPSLFCDGGGG